jgi:hypothetical protein
MSLPRDLLIQARHLATKDKGRPLQASLRRSISSAYYALFHLLASDGAIVVAAGGSKRLRERVQRTFDHGTMREVCKSLGDGQVPRFLDQIVQPIPPEIIEVAKTFVDLQAARHVADYDMSSPHDRLTALEKIKQAESAFGVWSKVRQTEEARAFLIALLLSKQLRR